MRKFFTVALLCLGMLTGISRAGADEAGGADRISGIPSGAGAATSPAVRGHVSSSEQKASRAAKLKAKIKAIEEGRLHAAKKIEKPVPVAHQSARGSDQIRKKMEATEESGKKATRKLKSLVSGFMKKVREFSGKYSVGSREDGKSALKRQRERKMSFREQLKLELDRQRERKKARREAE